MPAFITEISTANPDYKLPQAQVAKFMSKALKLSAEETRQLEILYRASGIKYRYSAIRDYDFSLNGRTFFPETEDLEPFPTVKKRMEFFQRAALPLAQKALAPLHTAGKLADLTHLITVSCTGMYAPGLDIEIISALQLPTTLQRTAINYMGCYAAFNALKMAQTICHATPDAKVLIVCLELCSLHFQKSKDQDTLLANALFGDGAAAVLVQPKPQNISLSLEHFYCDIAPAGKQDMAWTISDFGFEMKLSSYVPDIIKSGIKTLTEKLLSNLNLQIDQMDLFAIHPGGKRILQVIEEALGMDKNDNAAAYHVLKNYGNMSSPTVLFVLKELMEKLSDEDEGKRVLSFAFGPGLTLESMLLKVVTE